VELAVNCSNYAVVADGVSVNVGVQLSGLKPGLRYCVRVSAQNAVGTSPSSQVLEVKTLDNTPSAPTALAVKPATTSIVLSWAPVVVAIGSAVTDYVIEYSSNNGVSWVRINDGQSSKTSTTVSGLKSKRNYLFRVSAVNLAGASSPSKTLKVTTK
jgi:predicted phage tail protein